MIIMKETRGNQNKFVIYQLRSGKSAVRLRFRSKLSYHGETNWTANNYYQKQVVRNGRFGKNVVVYQ